MIFVSTDPRDPAPTAEQLAELQTVLDIARDLIRLAAQKGVVLTVEQKPLRPLTMGHYETVPTVRLERKRAEP